MQATLPGSATTQIREAFIGEAFIGEAFIALCRSPSVPETTRGQHGLPQGGRAAELRPGRVRVLRRGARDKMATLAHAHGQAHLALFVLAGTRGDAGSRARVNSDGKHRKMAKEIYRPECLPWAPAQMSSYLMDRAASPKTKAAAKKKQPRNGLASIYLLIGPDRGDRPLPGCRDR